VRILAADGAELARGLARYDSEDARAIRGLKSDAIEAALGLRIWRGSGARGRFGFDCTLSAIR
jgi:glutamate 5-kinase